MDIYSSVDGGNWLTREFIGTVGCNILSAIAVLTNSIHCNQSNGTGDVFGNSVLKSADIKSFFNIEPNQNRFGIGVEICHITMSHQEVIGKYHHLCSIRL